MKFRCVVFDLDDTLYLEREYVRSGFKAVSRTLGKPSGINWKYLFAYLCSDFEQGIRGNAFDRLFGIYPILKDYFEISDVVQAYGGHDPNIELISGVRELLVDLHVSGTQLALITDGRAESQSRKVSALGISDFIQSIVLTDKWGRAFWKPHPRAFEYLMESASLSPSDFVYIGDNPEKDFLAPNTLGWHTIRLRFPGQLRYKVEAQSDAMNAKSEAHSIEGLYSLLLENA